MSVDYIPRLENLNLYDHLCLLWYVGILTVKAALFLTALGLWYLVVLSLGFRWWRRGELRFDVSQARRALRKTWEDFRRLKRDAKLPAGQVSREVKLPLTVVRKSVSGRLAKHVFLETGVGIKGHLGAWRWAGGEAVAVAWSKQGEGPICGAPGMWWYYVVHQGVLSVTLGKPRYILGVLRGRGIDARMARVPVRRSATWCDKTEEIIRDREPTALVTRVRNGKVKP
jgi:hypothetical protein